MRAESPSVLLDGFHNIFLAEVDEFLRAEAEAHISLLITVVDGEYAETHCFRVLTLFTKGISDLLSLEEDYTYGKTPKPTSRPGNGDGLAWARARFFQRLVYCDAGA